MSTESVMPSNHLILYRPLLLPSVFPIIRIFSSESVLHIRWPKYWSSSFSISPSNAYSGLISFRMNWLDLLAVQGTLKSLLQHHSSKASIIQCSDFLWSNSHIHPGINMVIIYNNSVPLEKTLAVQGTLKSLIQHHNSKASILWHSAFFIVHLSHPYMITGKTIALTRQIFALTRQTFAGKVMSLLFNMLCWS